MLTAGSDKSHDAAIFLAEAQGAQRCIFVITLCALGALARSCLFFSLAKAQRAQRYIFVITLCESQFFFCLTGAGSGCCVMLSTGSYNSHDAAIFLAETQGAQRTSVFNLFLSQTLLRTWRPGEIMIIFSLAKAQRAQRYVFVITLCELSVSARVSFSFA